MSNVSHSLPCCSTELCFLRSDVIESPEGYQILVECPGVDKEHMNVEIDNIKKVLSVSIGGKMEGQETMKEGSFTYTWKGRSRNYQTTRFPLPEGVDYTKITSALEKGVLNISIPKTTPTPTAPSTAPSSLRNISVA